MQTNCPNCNCTIDTDDNQSKHQVNDNTEETYCSYECSAVATLKYLNKQINHNSELSMTKVQEIILNT